QHRDRPQRVEQQLPVGEHLVEGVGQGGRPEHRYGAPHRGLEAHRPLPFPRCRPPDAGRAGNSLADAGRSGKRGTPGSPLRPSGSGRTASGSADGRALSLTGPRPRRRPGRRRGGGIRASDGRREGGRGTPGRPVRASAPRSRASDAPRGRRGGEGTPPAGGPVSRVAGPVRSGERFRPPRAHGAPSSPGPPPFPPGEATAPGATPAPPRRSPVPPPTGSRRSQRLPGMRVAARSARPRAGKGGGPGLDAAVTAAGGVAGPGVGGGGPCTVRGRPAPAGRGGRAICCPAAVPPAGAGWAVAGGKARGGRSG